MRDTARRALVATLVAGGVVVLALALWKLRTLIALLFLAFIIAAAMRPGVEALRRRGVPRAAGIGLHYAALLVFVGLFLWLAVPRALDQIQEALGGDVPTSRSELKRQASEASGVKQQVLQGIENRLEQLPAGEQLLDPAVEATLTAFEVFLGIFFTLASAAYWIYERDRAVGLVLSALPRRRRRVVHEAWNLIDAKLGAFVRGELLLIVFVATLLSVGFYLIGLPLWILIGTFAGVVEIVPVIGPIVAGALAIGMGFTVSWKVALAAGLIVLGVRLLEDYLVIPRVLGHAVGLTPLVVLVSVSAAGLLFGGFAVILAIPAAAVLATVVDVAVRDRDPAEEEVPAVLFPAKESEAG